MLVFCVFAVLVCGAIQNIIGLDRGKCAGGTLRRYPHPTYCHKYYVCSRDSTPVLNCEDGDMFDAKLQGCASEGQVDCMERIKIFSGENQIGSCRMVLCMYSYGDPLTPNDLNPELCTHINFQRAVFLTAEGVVFIDQNSRETAIDLLRLKERNPYLKFILTIQDSWRYKFPQNTNSTESRALLVDTAIKLIREINFDGLQFGWWIPHEGPDPYLSVLKETMNGLINELRESDKARLLLFHMAGMKPYLISKGYYNVEEIHPNVDYTILHGMDLEGPYRKRIGHHSSPNAISQAIDMWISKGHPANKLILNLPLFGCIFQLTDPSNTTIGAPSTGYVTTDIPVQTKNCAVSYANTCLLIKDYNFTTVYDDTLGAPYMYKDSFWMGYDDPYSLKYKVMLALERGLAGVSANTLNHDDYSGSQCGRLTYPLLKALVSACQSF